MSKKQAKVYAAKVYGLEGRKKTSDTAEVEIRRGSKCYTVYVYAQDEGINFSICDEDGNNFDVDGASYEELDGEE